LQPFLLKQYFVTNISVKAAVPNFSSSDEFFKAMTSDQTNISTKVETATNAENPRLWKVALSISCRPSEGTNFCPYLIDAELLGFFEVHQSVADSSIQDLVTCNGPAILFGALREIVVLITGRGPSPAFVLPSVTFVDGSVANRKKAASQSARQ
jgi:preprotein translocase subunit SecB